uniref:Uncharacterized protein n=1 Tax=Rhizophora mucronata TaxID=61149 RepID=A0A2P2LYZ6_RHIMU
MKALQSSLPTQRSLEE